MKFTVAITALLAEAATSSSSNKFSTLHGHYPSKHQAVDVDQAAHVPGRQLESLSVFSSSTKKQSKEDHAMDIAKTLLKNKKQKASDTSASSTSRGQKLHSWIAMGRKHQLVDLVDQEEFMEECDPYQTADVGILACGQGRYCLESSLVSSAEKPIESSMGGICVDMPSESTVDLLDTLVLSPHEEQGSRNLQANDTSIIDDMYEICYGNFSAPTVSCDCQGIDVAAYTGSLSCQYQQICGDLNNICGDNVTFCYQVTYDLSVSAQYTGGFQTSYDFTSPSVFKYEYGVSYTGSPEPTGCTIAFDGTQCTSCEFTQILYPGEDTPTECITFDCGNTDLGLAATLCDYTIVELVIADRLLYGSLPCANGCNLCGDGGYMTQTYNNVTFPTGESYSCGLVEIAALAGYFDGVQPDLCALLPPLVSVPCGCSGGDITPPDSNATAAPVAIETVPTEAPVLAPVAVPSDPPVAAPVAPPSSAVKSQLGLATLAATAMGWVLQQVMSN